MQSSVEGEQRQFCWSRSCPGLCYPTQGWEEQLELQTGRRHQKNAPVSDVPSAVYLILSLRAGVIFALQAGREKMKAPWAGLGPRLGAPPCRQPLCPRGNRAARGAAARDGAGRARWVRFGNPTPAFHLDKGGFSGVESPVPNLVSPFPLLIVARLGAGRPRSPSSPLLLC